jgi:hypothetical protein
VIFESGSLIHILTFGNRQCFSEIFTDFAALFLLVLVENIIKME